MAQEAMGVCDASVVYRFGNVQFDPTRLELRVAGRTIDVQRKPLEVLALLLANAGEIVTKEELVETVWHGRPLVDNVVPSAVARLRLALGGEGAQTIVTHHRIGYRFTGTLERIAVQASGSDLQLTPGGQVPGRSTFVLTQMLSRSRDREVWSAQHAKTSERRVYKLCATSHMLAAFRREVALMRLLRESLGQRSDIVRLMDWNFESAPYFIEYEYAGQCLTTWAADALAKMSLARRLEFFLQIGDAVAATHSASVLHKDIKPANVLVSGDAQRGWRIHLADFGNARLLAPQRLAELGITQIHAGDDVTSDPSSGTPLYLAPELFAGSPSTQLTDVYALGVLLYQLMCADLRKPMVSGWERNIVDPLLRSTIAAATDGDPPRRLQSVTALTDRLRGLERRRAQTLREMVTLAPGAVTSRDNRFWLVTTLAAIIVALVLSAVWR